MAATDDFSRSVDMGLRLSKRIYYGKDNHPSLSTTAPKPPSMDKCLSSSSSISSFRLPQNHHPTAPMIYAVIAEPVVVDNPDIRSYQPYVHGRCDPPALIPLNMVGVTLEVECYLDTAFVSVSGTWRLHCVTSSAVCDCRVVIPMGEQGSVLGVEAETSTRLYFTQFISPKDDDEHTTAKSGNGFGLSLPFTFPAHVFPVFKRVSCTEKILLHVNSGTSTQITCNTCSHPLKELKRHVGLGQLSLSYDAEVLKWSSQDFYFAYSVCSNEIFGGLLLQAPSLHDYDQRDIFCFYLFPGSNRSVKAFRKEVVFVIDISGSMRDGPLEKTKYEVLGSLWKLNHGDSFNILASNGWQLIWLVNGDCIPLIFLITDGAVEDERDICSYCNHYFLQMLANIGKGCYDFAYDVDSISFRMQRLLDKATTPLLSNITLDGLENLKSHELFPFHLPDLWCGSPLIVSGRFEGNFPDIVKVRGFLGDLSTYVIDVKVRKAKNMPLDMVCARREVGTLTTHAWLEQDTKLEEKVAKMSLQRGVPSEYTRMILVQNENIKPSFNSVLQEEKYIKSMNQKTSYPMNLNIGFGNLIATVENLPPGIEELQLSETTGKVMQTASCCWTIFRDKFCCKCFIRTCGQCNIWSPIRDGLINPFLSFPTPKYVRIPAYSFLSFPQNHSSSSSSFTVTWQSKMLLRCRLWFRDFVLIILIASSSIASLSLRQLSRSSANVYLVEKERTLAIVKPDGVSGNYTSSIRKIILDSGFNIQREVTLHLDEDSVRRFYAEHSTKSFYPRLVKYMTSGPVLIMILQKVNAIADWRALIGPTDAQKARMTHPDSIRAMCGEDIEQNCVHGSDSVESAAREISFFFTEPSPEGTTPEHDEL
ncbi:hypothetical protein OSB04_004918 [Centaurea solstitialis]|uniref:Nucleoside diphosphate kinase-like domain-containing protein n=1 Tax=Centaurea solstitialis TaxID=347529 RepID=A0AA38TMK6_9ASTR|nr:hypothetical protein OSB04_004918 [Centaurea solstitialis]